MTEWNKNISKKIRSYQRRTKRIYDYVSGWFVLMENNKCSPNTNRVMFENVLRTLEAKILKIFKNNLLVPAKIRCSYKKRVLYMTWMVGRRYWFIHIQFGIFPRVWKKPQFIKLLPLFSEKKFRSISESRNFWQSHANFEKPCELFQISRRSTWVDSNIWDFRVTSKCFPKLFLLLQRTSRQSSFTTK